MYIKVYISIAEDSPRSESAKSSMLCVGLDIMARKLFMLRKGEL
jgi:hypothetical protein